MAEEILKIFETLVQQILLHTKVSVGLFIINGFLRLVYNIDDF